MRDDHVTVGGLRVAPELHDFVDSEVLPGLDVSAETVWSGLAELVTATAPAIAQALQTRAKLQQQIDDWHRERAGQPHDTAAVPRLPRVDRLHRPGR